MKKMTEKLKKNFLVSMLIKLWKHPKGRLGLCIVAFLAIIAIFAPVIAPYNPYDVTQRAAKGITPCWEHPLGTTITTGQDILSMLIYGTRVSPSPVFASPSWAPSWVFWQAMWAALWILSSCVLLTSCW